MKKYTKLYVLLGVVALMGACQENDLVFEGIEVIPGNEILFGATAHFENGDLSSTRTEYGDIVNNKVEVNWVSGVDRIQIASPHTTGIDVAEYMVTGASDATLGEENGSDKSTATSLKRIGEAGLQWTNNATYEFYAMYPSHNQLGEIVTEVTDTEKYGLKTSVDANGNQLGTMTGYLPLNQTPADLSSAIDPVDDGFVVAPDMRYAYMVAKEFYTVPDDGVIDTDAEKIQLAFSSLVTALQFDITANSIGFQKDGSNQITVTALTLYSESGSDICGTFKYTYPQGEEEDVTKGTFETENPSTGYNQIVMELGEGIPLSESQSIDVTFFLLPSVKEYSSGDLKLNIHFSVAGDPQVRTATINETLTPRKKYYFSNMVMPSIPAGLTGSSWLSALDDNTYVSQLSIPVAGNAFSYAYTTTSTETVDKADYHKQQVLDYQILWNQGVRGFEFVTSAASPSTSFGDEKFVCNGAEIESGITFDEAFGNIADMLEIEGCKKEFAVIIAKYQSYRGDEVTGGYAPQTYIDQLFNYLYNQTHISRDKIVQLNNRSTIGDLRGCIAVLVRPGDDDYMQYVNSTTTTDLSLPTVSGIDWSTKASLISDWGSAVDCWHRRYGDNYYAEGAFSSGGATGEVAFDPFSWETSSWCWIPETTPEGIQSSTELSTYSDYLVGSGGEVTLAQSGDYEVTFTYQGGSHKLNIAGVDLLEKDSDGNYTIVKYSDYHYGYTGGNQYNKVYSLDNVDAGTYLLRIFGLTYAIEEETTETFDSYGNITWTCDGSAVTSGNGLTLVNETDYLTSNAVKLIYENNLMSSSSSDASFNGTWPSLPTYSRDYAHYVNYGQSNAGTAWIQSWERVVPSAEKFNSGWYSGLYNVTGDYLWLRWPESVSEKKAMIDETYAASVATKGNTESSVLFINSLSGFFVTEEVAESYYPYVENSYDMTDQGKGGDYASCAAELNTYFYNKIKNTSEGPYGLVILDFINASETDFADIGNTTSSVSAAAAATASQKLTNLILMNNFKFPLAVKPSTVEEASLYLSDKLVDPDQPVQVRWEE